MSNYLFRGLFTIYAWLFKKAYGSVFHKTGEIKMNYIVKDDNPDVGFSVALGQVTDAEGNAISDTSGLTVDVESSDESVVKVSNTNGKGSVSFGAPGTAAVTVTVKSGDKTLATGGDNFTVTTGDPAAITSVTVTFDGLTPADQPSA